MCSVLFCQLYKAKVVDIEVINFTFTGQLERFVDLEENVMKIFNSYMFESKYVQTILGFCVIRIFQGRRN